MNRVAIVGMGLSGRAALSRLYRRGVRDFLLIDRKSIESLQEQFPDARLDCLLDQPALEPSQLKGLDHVILSPGVGPDSTAYQQLRALGIPIQGEMELGLEGLAGRKVVVTGSCGKSTTVSLCAHLLQAAGWRGHAVGNIGLPLSAIEQSRPDDLWIVEASSYQLEVLTQRHFELGVLLNIEENHLDRYGTLAAYALAKASIQKGLLTGASLWLDRASLDAFSWLWHWPLLRCWSDLPDPLEEGDKSFAAKDKRDYNIELIHDRHSVKAALAICLHLGLSLEQALSGLGSYRKLPHRLERVGEHQGICFINDSKSTSVVTTEHALKVVEGPLVLIAGGVHKGASYTPWRELLKAKALGVCVLGRAQELICRDLEGCCPLYRSESLQQALEQAWGCFRGLATGQTGTVLLSPGCASLDMFRNFEERGQKFRESIDRLKAWGTR